MKEYIWRGYTYRIADEDLPRYPGAVPVEKEEPKKAKAEPKNKARAAKNKSSEEK